ncbi:MAG: MBOAT family O-acyltransferase [Bacilli bacterium]|uniref:MBOAT family O-acyltransferase n=1 Tax=Anaerorhabdus sp. TaxID=1872524 RepID=UPI002FC5B68D
MGVLSFNFIGFVSFVFILTWLTKGEIRKIILLVSNVFFVMSFGNLFHLSYLVFIIFYTYYFSKYLLKVKSKKGLILAIVIPILVLIYFKYFNFIKIDNLVMPIGISFYTFKVISHLVDTYKRNDDIDFNLFDYSLYVSFFPCLSAGPIHRSCDFFNQLSVSKSFDYKTLKNGATLCAFGMFQKIVIADYLNIVVKNILDNPEYTGVYVLFGLFLYSFQLYVDFDAYSNIAIGVSNMLGFNIKRNFYTPYLSVTLQEFWHRWHISLSTWIRDYIYIPLGGNRKGLIRKYTNIFIAFGLSGLWHGSSFVFLLWGFGHGLVLIIEETLKPLFKDFPMNKFTKILGIATNFIIVSFLWILFRNNSIQEVMDILSRLIQPDLFALEYLGMSLIQFSWVIILVMITVITDVFRYKTNMITWFNNKGIVFRWCTYVCLIAIVIVFGVYGTGYNPNDFIYITF